jgi:hypothetical protein
MEKKTILLAVLITLVILGGQLALALDPMGPPTAGLKKGQFSASIEYFYEEGDLRLNNNKLGSNPEIPVTVRSRVHMVTGVIGYGFMDNLEAFLRAGSGVYGKASGDWRGDEMTFDGDGSFVIGFGTKATFCERDSLKLGGLFQMSWSEHDGEMVHNYDGHVPWPTDVSTVEVQFAVGPTYQWMDNVAIYGGPFLNYIDGDVDGKYEGSMKYSCDIDNASNFGGYIGTTIDITKNIAYNIEYLHTATDDALGMCLVWRH